MRTFAAAVLLSWFPVFGAPASGASLDVAFCRMPVSPLLRQADLDFTARATFTVDAAGRPTDIHVDDEGFVRGSDVRACLETWRLPGADPEEEWSATFSWTHGAGWTKLVVRGPSGTTTVRVTGGREVFWDAGAGGRARRP